MPEKIIGIKTGHHGDWIPRKRPAKNIIRTLVIYETLRKECKRLDYKPSQY